MGDEILVKVERLYKSYSLPDGELPVLRGLDLEIGKGDMVAVVGSSGSGKSTLLHLMGALDRPTSGKVYYDGLDIYGLDDGRLARIRGERVGFVFQFHYLLPEFTALENVAMPLLIRGVNRREATSKAREFLAEVGLAERLQHKPGRLSGGEQQRVAIARALVGSPTVVLADEPTGNLDSETTRTIQALMLRLNGSLGQAFVIATHNESLARSMKRVVRLVDGVLREEKWE
jgi:lipoprotein-releasing system ATP-binding protein